MKFKYKNQIIETPNLEKKLKRMNLSLEDIEIIEDTPKLKDTIEEVISPKLYYFKHPDEETLIVSIYPTIDKMISYFKENSKFYWDEETKTGLGRKWTLEYIIKLERYEFIEKLT